MGKLRPRTKFKMKTISRRCPKCHAAINNQRTRCKKCAKLLTKPKKKKGSGSR